MEEIEFERRLSKEFKLKKESVKRILELKKSHYRFDSDAKSKLSDSIIKIKSAKSEIQKFSPRFSFLLEEVNESYNQAAFANKIITSNSVTDAFNLERVGILEELSCMIGALERILENHTEKSLLVENIPNEKNKGIKSQKKYVLNNKMKDSSVILILREIWIKNEGQIKKTDNSPFMRLLALFIYEDDAEFAKARKLYSRCIIDAEKKGQK